MCGFTFILDKNKNKFAYDKKFFLEKIKIRGNDSSGTYNDNDISIFFQRLSIIDHELGDQPMFDHSKRFIISFSGEIYNYQEIKKDLTVNGSRFETNSDTEVILEGYKSEGQAIVKKLNGMFSFIIWDFKKKEAFVARDRVGKKPLYYINDDNLICLSTNISTFEYFGKVNKKNINISSLQNFIIFNSEPSNKNFFYKGINKFPAGCTATLNKNQIKVYPNQFWSILFEKKNKSLESFMEEYDFLLNDSVKIRLRSNTKKALALSGGVDSSSIAMIALRNLGEKLNYFNIDYENYRLDSEENDDPSELAKFINVDIEKIRLSEEQFFDYLNKCINFSEVPNNQPQSALLYKLCEEVGKESKILLSGNGADEIFLGYNGDEKKFLINEILNRMPQFIKNYINKTINNLLIKKNQLIINKMNLNSYNQKILTNTDLLSEKTLNSCNEPLDLKLIISLFTSSESSNYVNPDTIGLRNHVEIRSPFLDYRIIEFASSLPNKFKIGNIFNNKQNKLIVKKNLEKYLPKRLIYKKKRGFGWNLNLNKLFIKKYDNSNIFDSLEEFGFNKKFFIDNKIKFIKEAKNNLHPNYITSRIFFNSIMVCNWLKK